MLDRKKSKILMLQNYGIDIDLIEPHIINLSENNLRKKIDLLTSIGIDISKNTKLLALSYETIYRRIRFLQEYSIPIAKTPSILLKNELRIQRRIRFLSRYDRFHPSKHYTLLNYAEDSLNRKIELLESYGIDVNHRLTLLSLSLNRLKEKLDKKKGSVAQLG